jgi:hypothetical protein
MHQTLYKGKLDIILLQFILPYPIESSGGRDKTFFHVDQTKHKAFMPLTLHLVPSCL